jgi:hypothetical protein
MEAATRCSPTRQAIAELTRSSLMMTALRFDDPASGLPTRMSQCGGIERSLAKRDQQCVWITAASREKCRQA